MQIPPNAKRIFEIICFPRVIAKDPTHLASDLKIAQKAKELFYVLASLFALGSTYCIAASYLTPSLIFGICLVISIIVYRRLYGFIKKSEALQNREVYRFDYMIDEKEWITLKFNDGTLKVARYLMRFLIRDRLLGKNNFDMGLKEHVVDNMSWKELMLKVRYQIENSCDAKGGNLFFGHRGFSCFGVLKRIVNSEVLNQKLSLLKTLGKTQEDLYLRGAIENSLTIPPVLIKDPVWKTKIQEAHLSSLHLDPAITDKELSELIDLCKELKVLHLKETLVTEKSLFKLVNLPLERLSLNSVTDKGLEQIGKITTLKNLSITLTSHSPLGTRQLEKLPLTFLWFKTDHLTKEDIVSFGKMTSLTRLILNQSIKTQHEKELSELSKTKQILNISVTCT